MALAADGSVYLASSRSRLYRVPARGGVESIPLPAVAAALLLDGDRLLLGSRRGLLSLPAGRPLRGLHAETVPGTGGAVIEDVRSDGAGGLLLASSRGLLRVASGRAQPVGGDSPGRYLQAVERDRAGYVWTPDSEGRVGRFRIEDGRLRRAAGFERPLLHSGEISFLAEDSRGWMWVGGDRGVDVLAPDGWHWFSQDDGLIWNDVNQHGFYEARDHSVWIATSAGISHLLAPELASCPPTAEPRIVGLSYGAQKLPASGEVSVRWPGGPLRVEFGSLGFRNEHNVLFRYRMRGLDEHWAESIYPVASYQRLPPGEYRFELQAVDGARRPLSNPQSFALRVRAPWWRSLWLYVVLPLLAAAAVMVAWQVRMAALRRRQRELERLVAIRTGELEEKNRTIEAARLELQHKAMYDGLTGLYNRSAILDLLEREVGRCHREQRPLAIVIPDLDYFKQVNDSFGHLAGDRVLAEVARRLRPGEIPSALWDAARALADEAGLGARFMGPPGDQARFVGHGVGLELDELPVLAPGFDEPLVAGQVVAVEPKFVFPGLGAVGIENTWAVGEGGGERLTDFPDDLLRVA
jgi:hypothetical protein